VRYLATILITLLLAVPAMSVELFRYRGAATDGGTLEYIFEGGEQNSPDAVPTSGVMSRSMASGAVRIPSNKCRPHGFSLSVLGDEARLLDLLNQETLSHVAEAFYIEKDWLTGSSNSPAKTEMYWYKNLYLAAEELLQFNKKRLDPQVFFIKRERANLSNLPDVYTAKPSNPSGTEHVGIVVRLSRRAEDGVRYQAYQLWEFAEWEYSRSRAQFKALIAFCERARSSGLISFTGGVLPEDSIEKLEYHQVLPVDIMKTMPCWNWRPQDTLSSNDEDKESVWREYNHYELDNLLHKYDPFQNR
jgi:hypothetical protein